MFFFICLLENDDVELLKLELQKLSQHFELERKLDRHFEAFFAQIFNCELQNFYFLSFYSLFFIEINNDKSIFYFILIFFWFFPHHNHPAFQPFRYSHAFSQSLRDASIMDFSH